MNRRLLLAAALTCCIAPLTAQDDEGQLLIEGRSLTHEWRLHAGLAEDFTGIHFREVDGGGDERRDLDGEPGLELGAELLWNHLGYSRLGLVHGPGISLGLHRGEGEDGDAELQQASLTYRAGLLMRWDNRDEMASLRHLRFELTPVIGVGLAQVELDGSDDSDPGYLLRYGILFESVADFRPGFTISAGVGYMGGRAWLDWDNTDGSTADLEGFVARLGAGLRF